VISAITSDRVSWQVLFASTLLLLSFATLSLAQAQDPAQLQSQIQSQKAEQTSPGKQAPPNAPAATPEPDPLPVMFPHVENDRYWISGQANFIFQAHPAFHALYSGPHSFQPQFEHATSRLLTLYTGMRVNDSMEVLVDIEDASGFGMSNSLGLAGYTNLDVVRIPGEGSPLSTAPYVARAIIHKVFALSEDKVENERNPLSLFSELPRRRLEIRFGKFTLPDFFDQNSVGSDTHFQFTNWTVDNNGAFDYAADTRGYTVGLIADYEDRNWGFRFGQGLMPKIANGIDLVWKPWQVNSENFEYEFRRSPLPGKPGILRILAYMNNANMGIYRHAVAQFEQHLVATPDITNHPWHITRKYGFGVNLEQSLAANLKAFGRFGWNNGKTESFAYTEVDQTLAAGLKAEGVRWRRRYDRAGLAFVTNAISKDHQIYLADGGLGFLLGDGRLNYGRENILETYYTAHVWRGIYASPGLQHINNPGYNRNRGPVLVPSGRLHLEF
jgi:high affinity Mn2+ porin